MVKSVTAFVRALALLAVVVAACGAPSAAPGPTSDPAGSATPTLSVATAAAPSPAVSPTGEPEPTQGPRAEPPAIALDPRPIPIEFTLLHAPRISAEVQSALRASVEGYLSMLDHHRATGDGMFPVHGAFGDAVRAGLAASATQGVKRKFALESMEVQRYLVKPWGTTALAEVRVTIVDRAVEGSAPEERESGRLRLLGDRLQVQDGWDASQGRWFNGSQPMSDPRVRQLVMAPLGSLLGAESWLPGSPMQTSFGRSDTAFSASRNAYLMSFDRAKTVSRTFTGVSAQVERYETDRDVDQGLATVRLRGTVVTVDASGAEGRAPFERRVVILSGNWIPEVVDEEITAGVWRSGGDLALKDIDVNRA